VNAVVQAAFIGVAGTVIVGVAGFGASIWNTRKAFAANRQSWIRDQRATAYVDAIAAMHYRQFARQVAAGHGPPTEEARSEALASYKSRTGTSCRPAC
jgi:NO-binding membrane sensor protein with MHYT domain